MSTRFEIHEVGGEALEPWLDALGRLRIRVFQEYPYLYEGSLEYERDYLRTYQEAARSCVVLVTTPGEGLIGATTCIPLAAEIDAFREPFIARGIDPGRVLYLGESIVLPEWRGIGLGKEFFRRREAHANRLGLELTAFCAVDRPDDHPLRPPGYRPLDGFWQARGYQKQPGLQASLAWKEMGEPDESPKSLTFWLKRQPDRSGLVDRGIA